MPQFFIDKSNKVPLYLQLKDQIKYYVATGALGLGERLPPVKALATTLSINFLTVRKAYQELAVEGLVVIKHGDGTFISIDRTAAANPSLAMTSNGRNANDLKGELERSIDDAIKRGEAKGLSLVDAMESLNAAIGRLETRSAVPVVIFTECNHFQITEISALLEAELGIDVRPCLIDALEDSLAEIIPAGNRVNVVPTGFHVTKVRDAIGDRPIDVDVLITNLNPNTRRKLEAVGENGKFSFICRDRESTVMYKDLLKAELGFKKIDMTSCTIYESAKVQEALRASDAVLASPPVYDAVRKIAPHGVAVYNVFERVDPMSLKVLRDRILANGSPVGR